MCNVYLSLLWIYREIQNIKITIVVIMCNIYREIQNTTYYV